MLHDKLLRSCGWFFVCVGMALEQPLNNSGGAAKKELYEHLDGPAAAPSALLAAFASMVVGFAMLAVSGGSLSLWLTSGYFHDTGNPQFPNGWEGYTDRTFVGLVLFTFLTTIGYSLSYIGVCTLVRVSPPGSMSRALGVFFQALLAIVSIGLGLAGAIVWGGNSFMGCLGAFCVDTNKYKEISPPAKPSAGWGWMGVVGTAACFGLVPFGIILLTRAAFAALSFHQNVIVHVPQSRARSHASTFAWFVAAELMLLGMAIVSFYMPNTWESFSDARIAHFAQVQVLNNDWDTCSNNWKHFTCPEYPWAWFVSRQIKLSNMLVLKLFPGNLFLYLYLMGILAVAVLVTHTKQSWAVFWTKAMPQPAWMPKRIRGWLRMTRGEFVGMWITKWFIMVTAIYWLHDHSFNGAWQGTAKAAAGSAYGYVGMSASERWARGFGQLAVTFLSLLLFAASRHSVMHRLLGTSWESFLWVHRVLGYLMLLFSVLHMAIWWVRYNEEGLMPKEIFRVPSHNPTSIDNFTVPLATLATWLLIICMGGFALEPVRRRYFELFYYSHLLAAYIIIPVTLWHAAAGWEYMLPGLTVWFFDRLVRAVRSSETVRVLSAIAVQEGETGVVEIKFVTTSKTLMALSPGQYVFVNVPEISLFEWHPFTISTCACEATPYLSLHIKGMGAGSWTQRLNDLVKKHGSSFTLAVDGPHGTPIHEDLYTDLFLIAGGIGITPCAAIFAMLKQKRFDSALQGGPCTRRLRLVWAVREHCLLEFFAGHLSTTPDADGSFNDASFAGDAQANVFMTRDCAPKLKEELGRAYNFACGRPNLEQMLTEALLPRSTDEWELQQFSQRRPLVFVCGPEPVVQTAQAWCDRNGISFHRETFLL